MNFIRDLLFRINYINKNYVLKFLLSVLHIGFITKYLSDVIVSGFTVGAGT